MDAQQRQTLVEQQAQFMRETVQAQTAAHNAAMNTMAQMVTTLRTDLKNAVESRSRPKEKDGLTTKRAYSLLLA